MLHINFHPFPLLTTERCVLRRLQKSDAEQVLFLRSNDAVMKYVDREKSTTLAEAQAVIATVNKAVENNSGIMWGICQHHDHRLIGKIGYWRLVKEHYRAEIGYVLHPDFWNKGIMSEVLRTVLRYGFEQMQLHSIEANVNPANGASIRLLQKNGFVQEAYFHENYYFRGRFLDTAIYSLLAPGYERAAPASPVAEKLTGQ